jgi:cellulose synthase/poly-beta-1,6-N-acetylglucosamine synthase-like glycosyltransferase
MTNDILNAIFLLFVLATLVAIIGLVCMHLYQIFEEPGLQKRMRQLRKPIQPWVTVLLYAHNDETTIEASLKSLLRSNYYCYDIVVVDDRSTDATAKRVQDFIASHQKISISLLRRRVKHTAQGALKAGYRKSKKGKIVVSLRAGTIVQSSFLKRAVATKQERPQIVLRVTEPIALESLSSIIQSLVNLVWHRSYKVQVSDVKNITFVNKPARVELIGPFVLAALIFTSIILKEGIVLWYSWLIVTGYVYAVIWLNEAKIRYKLRLTFSGLSALFLLPVASIVMALSQPHSRN